MRHAIAALVAAGCLLVLALPASADLRHARLGDVAATLTLTRADGYVAHLQLSVSKAGAVVFSGPITTAAGRPGALQRTPAVREFLGARLRVLDLDGDGSGEAIVDLAERGSYCCSHTIIVGAGADGTYRALELDWGSFDMAAEPQQIKDGYLLVGGDARLDERFTPHVLSFAPVRVWRYDHGTVQDVSRSQPTFVQAGLARALAERRTLLRRADHRQIDLRGLLTAITGDRLLLGRRAAAVRLLRADVAAGNLRVSSGTGPTGAAFPPALLRLLARLGY